MMSADGVCPVGIGATASINGRSPSIICRLTEIAGSKLLVGELYEDHRGVAADSARDAMNQTRLLVNNSRVVNEADALAIYPAAF
jgi:hypothetical protein